VIPHALVVGAPRDVGRDRERALPEAAGDRGEGLFAPRGEDDASAARDGDLRELLADPRRRSRDDDDPILHDAEPISSRDACD
jgi:hypothetical protein